MPQTGPARMGAKVKALRRRAAMTQAQLAQTLGVSASYLNLIENDKRPLTARLLIALSRHFDVDVTSFASDADAALVSDLMEVFGDRLFDDSGITNNDVRELSASCPSVAQAVVRLYDHLQTSRRGATALAEQMVEQDDDERHFDSGRPPSEEVNAFLQDNNNYFPQLEEAAEALWQRAHLDADALLVGLTRQLQSQHGVSVEMQRNMRATGTLRRYHAQRRELHLSVHLSPGSRCFQLAHQLALLGHESSLNAHRDHPALTTQPARALARVAMANYFAAAVLMPYQVVLETAQRERYDIELLCHQFRVSYEQMAHRLTTLRRPGAEGIAFHFVRVDIAGNISKRFSGSGIRFARYSGGCPRWNVFAAFLTPGLIRTQVSQMPDGERYFCVARTVGQSVAGYRAPHAAYAVALGTRLENAPALVYADGVDLESDGACMRIGVSCRICERMDCEQRAFPPVHLPLEVDENVRGLSFYAPARGD